MEFENVNRAYDTLVKPKNEIYIKLGKKVEQECLLLIACDV
jgi:deoxyribodipyrimidine photo-lyase